MAIDIKESLTRKIGPLPLWGWGAIILTGLLIYRYRQQQQTGATYDGTGYGYSDSATGGYFDYGPATGSYGEGSTGGSAGGDEGYLDEGNPAPVAEPGDMVINIYKGKGKPGKNKNKPGKHQPHKPGKDTNETVSGKHKQGKHKGQNKIPANAKNHNNTKTSNKQKDPGGKTHIQNTSGKTYKEHLASNPFTSHSLPSNPKNSGGSNNGKQLAGIPAKSSWSAESFYTGNKAVAKTPEKKEKAKAGKR